MSGVEELKKIIAKNLKRELFRVGKTQTDVAQELNIPAMTMSNWMNAKTYPRADKIQLLADYFRIPRSDLTEEKTENSYNTEDKTDSYVSEASTIHYGNEVSAIKHENEIVQKTSNLIKISDNEFVRVPVLGEISCGDPIDVEENFKGYRTALKSSLPSGNCYYLEAKGNSMEPTIPAGSTVLIREQPDIENGEIAAVLVNGNTETTLKRVRKQGDTVLLVPDNPKYDTLIVSEESPVKIIGKAIKYEQDL